MGPLYSSYGLFLIKNYPMHYLRYFAGPNSLHYFFPPVEFLEKYNGFQPTVQESAVKWFGYHNDQVRTKTNSTKISILQFYPYLVSITNLILFLLLVSYLLLRREHPYPLLNKLVLLVGVVWIVNTGFTILSAPVALRFQ